MGPEELGQWIDRHAAALVLFARQWCASADDVVQEAFVKLSLTRNQPGQPLAWLYAVVRNAAISAGRSERRRRKHEQAARQTHDWFVPSEPTTLDASAAAQALDQIPDDEREVIVAHLWGGLSFDAIGKLTGSSAATAHRRYTAGLTALRERLGEQCPDPKT